MKCHILEPAQIDWPLLDRFEDRTVFQTREWLRFVSATQRAASVIAELRDGGAVAGYFTGLTFTRFGLRILGSSFPGWTTPYMGFNLAPGVSRAAALGAVEDMAFGTLKCVHMEVSDPLFTVEDGKSLGFECDSYASYRTDLTRSEEDLFNAMDSACRRCIRKAEKSGVRIEEAHDLAFADEYFEQLKEVFAKQGLVPTYGIDRVRALITHVEPAGRVLLLRARDPQGRCIATGIFPGFNRIAEFWGNASFRSSQLLRPNEAIHWYAMRYWKSRGVEVYDWGGEGTYKEKYGCTPHRVPWFSKSRYKVVSRLRNEAKRMFEQKQRLLGWVQAKHRRESGPGDT
ncbi:MAG TPA: GNAT family N-acetyltransferase [Terriglobia bacterium]|nr:GNAT family N-acetyltransferase [Terriglobia bacterium]